MNISERLIHSSSFDAKTGRKDAERNTETFSKRSLTFNAWIELILKIYVQHVFE